MSKSKKITVFAGLLSAAVVIIIITAGFFSKKNVNPENIKKYDYPLEYFELVSSGENGARSSVGVTLNNESALIEIERKDAVDYPVQRQKYAASLSLISSIEEIFYKYNIGSWSERKEHKLLTSDAANYELYFRFGSDEAAVRPLQIPEIGYKAVTELTELVYSNCSNENSSLALSEQKYDKKTFSLIPYSIENGYLQCGIVNNTNDVKTLNASFKMYSVSGKELMPVTVEDSERLSVPAGSEIPVQLDLNAFGKLEPGDYRIVFDETEVEITLTEN